MKPTKVLGYIKRRLRNGTTREYFVVNSKREKRSCSSILGSSYSRENEKPVEWSIYCPQASRGWTRRIAHNDGTTFTANGQRLKHYREGVRDEQNVTYPLTDP
ncbi:unnamed protein product [Rhodiola kirilowii]